MSLTTLLLLYICFRLKQFACDFLFQTGWMAHNKGKPGKQGWVPLFSHAGVHGAGTLLITLIFAPFLWWLAAVDFAVHSIIDRIKAVITQQREMIVSEHKYWITFGMDQEAHNFTHLIYIVLIFISLGGLS